MATKRRKRKTQTGSGISLKALFFIFILLAGALWMVAPGERGAEKVTASSEVGSLWQEKNGGEEKGTVTQWIEKVISPGHKDDNRTSVTNEKPLTKEIPRAKESGKPLTQPKGEVTGKLAVVIDDAGYDLASQRVYESLGVPFTLAVMPNKNDTGTAAKEWVAHGMEVILHQPMEPVSGAGMEDKTILTSMSDDDIRNMLNESLDQVPEVIGINNHQGSKATIDYRVMSIVSEELAKRRLFFLDSHTNTTTVADKTCLAFGVPYARNQLFVDNSTNESEIRQMIREGAERAKAHGTYIIIGHCRPHTAAAFCDMVPELLQEGIQFIYVSSLVK